MPHFVYILFSEVADRFYIGCSCDPMQRIEEHKLHRYDDSFTRRAKDWSLFWVSPPMAKSTAMQIEKHIKRMKSRKYLINLKKHPAMLQRLIDQYNDQS